MRQARVASAFGYELDEIQLNILKLIFEHHPCPVYLKDENLVDAQSLASTIPLLEDAENLKFELVLDEEE